MIGSSLLHLLLLSYWPATAIAELAREHTVMEQLEIPPEIEIPPPPQPLRRPAIPLLSPDLEMDLDLTIPPMIFGEPPAEPPPPPSAVGTDLSTEPAFTPFEVRPELRNRDEYSRAVVRRYPSQLRNSRIGGTSLLWVLIDEEGRVRETRIVESSGVAELDAIAQELIRDVARFSPALNRDRSVAVWIQLPVTFEVR